MSRLASSQWSSHGSWLAALSRAGLAAALSCPAVACTRDTPAASRPPEPTTSTSAAAPRLQLEVDRMAADIAVLAADEYHGRYTLGPDLRRAADFLAKRHAELGLQPVGENFLVDFPLRTGARLARPASVSLLRGERATPLASEDFVVLPQSGSGEVRGELVFVGYAVQSEPEKVDEKDAKAGAPLAYDDLAGVDVKGKVALVLLEAPGRPDPMTLFTRMQEEAQKFGEAAGPLKQAKDVAGLKQLHAEARGRLMAMVEPFMPKSALANVWPLPEDVLAIEYDLQKIVGGLMREAANLPGPRFAVGEGSLRSKVERLAKAGAVAVVTVRGPRSFLSPGERDADALPRLDESSGVLGESLPLPVVQMKWKAADRLLGKKQLSRWQEEIDRDRKPRSTPIAKLGLALSATLESVDTPVPNVLAQIPGGDLAQEIVMIGAHYDHIGEAGKGQCSEARDGDKRDPICNGADDNASGTAMVLELARAWQSSGRKPRRTIVFTHFAGEELGILGSKALADKPPFDLKRVVAMVNLDMVGRLGPKGLAVGGLGSSDGWMPLLDEVGAAGLEVLYEASVATRSDHASFYRKDIPVLFFFTGVHADYHRPGDHADKINLAGMGSIGQIVGGVMLALGDGYKLPWKPPGPQGGLSQGLPGSDPATVVKRVKAVE